MSDKDYSSDMRFAAAIYILARNKGEMRLFGGYDNYGGFTGAELRAMLANLGLTRLSYGRPAETIARLIGSEMK
jgi:hypothetical protein